MKKKTPGGSEREIFLKNKNIVIATHEYATGFPQHLRYFLNDKKTKAVLSIHHPLHPSFPDSGAAGYELYESGKQRQYKRLSRQRGENILFYVKSFFLDIWWVFSSKRTWDLYIGSNNLNAFAGLVLKKWKRVKKCAFYTVDFIPNRFRNPLLNSIYLWIDKKCVEHCDETWILSPRIREGRRRVLKLKKIYDAKQIEVPEGIWLSRIKQVPFSSVRNHTGVFVGVLLERMGVQLVLQAIPSILKKIPDFTCVIIGKGNYKGQLERLAKTLGIEQSVYFRGYIADFSEVERIVARCAVGFATYTQDESGLTYFADPAKTKTYLGNSVPVIVTDTFHNARDIEVHKAGIVVDEDPPSIAAAVVKIMKNDDMLKSYRKNAFDYARQFDHETIFTENLKRILL